MAKPGRNRPMADWPLAAVVQAVLNQVLVAQLAEHWQADRHERTADRQGYRNGDRERRLTTRVGTLVLAVPRDRDGTVSPTRFARYQRPDKALGPTRMERVIQGGSPRKGRRMTEELCGTAFSKSTVSPLVQDLAPVSNAWRPRRLDETADPFLLVDALAIRVREGGMVPSLRGGVVPAINAAGWRESLGVGVGNSESERTWRTVFQDLNDRGLRGVEWVVSDDHRGLVKALQTEFQGASWQRCPTHLTRNRWEAMPQSLPSARRDAVQPFSTPRTGPPPSCWGTNSRRRGRPRRRGRWPCWRRRWMTCSRGWRIRPPGARACAPPISGSG